MPDTYHLGMVKKPPIYPFTTHLTILGETVGDSLTKNVQYPAAQFCGVDRLWKDLGMFKGEGP